LVCLKTVLKNLLLKKFSRVVVVYCSVIKVLCLCRSFQATAFIFYQKLLSLSRTFLFFFVALFELSFAVSCDSLFRISLPELFVNNFFDLFFNHFIDFQIFQFPSDQECPASASSFIFRSSVVFFAVPQRRMLSYHSCF